MQTPPGSQDKSPPAPIGLPALAALTILLLLPASPAQAYIGPGAGLGAIGAFVGLLGAILLAIGVVVIWPIRRMMRKARAQAPQSQPPSQHEET